jgi:putative heme transporter
VSSVHENAPQAAPPTEEELELSAPAASDAPAKESASESGEPTAAEGEGASASAAEAPAEPPRAIVPRWVQLVVLPLAILALYVVAKAAGKVLVIFIVAALIALILNPAVSFLQRRRLPRGLAVLAVYLAFFLIVVGIGFLLANPISDQVAAFSRNVPHLIEEANRSLAELQSWLNEQGVHVEVIKQGHTALQTLGEKVVKGSSSVVSFGGSLLTEAVTAAFDLILVFVLSVYMLLYGEGIGRLIRRFMPDGDGTPADDYPRLVQHAVARYVFGQLLFSFVMGATATLALYIFGVLGIFPDGEKYAVLFGIFYGVMELIPYVGPIIGALPAVLVALFSDPVSALWVTLLFVGLQQLEGHLVAPQIFGHTLRINPLLVIFALLLGLQIHGVIGALIALPILAVLRETVVYLSRHIELESWSQSGRGLL